MIEIEYLTLIKIHLGTGAFTWLVLFIYQACKISDYELIETGFKSLRPFKFLLVFLCLGIFAPAIIFGVYIGDRN